MLIDDPMFMVNSLIKLTIYKMKALQFNSIHIYGGDIRFSFNKLDCLLHEFVRLILTKSVKYKISYQGQSFTLSATVILGLRFSFL